MKFISVSVHCIILLCPSSTIIFLLNHISLISFCEDHYSSDHCLAISSASSGSSSQLTSSISPPSSPYSSSSPSIYLTSIYDAPSPSSSSSQPLFNSSWSSPQPSSSSRSACSYYSALSSCSAASFSRKSCYSAYFSFVNSIGPKNCLFFSTVCSKTDCFLLDSKDSFCAARNEYNV